MSSTVINDASTVWSASLRRLVWIVVGLLAWFLVCEAVTQAWYIWKESHVPKTERWEIVWPTSGDAARRGFLGFRDRAMSDKEKELLRFESGSAANWRDGVGTAWAGFFIQWSSDRRLNEMDLTHNPTICLTGAGLRFVRELPEVSASAGERILSFRAWEFEGGQQTVFVYVATRSERKFGMAVYTAGVQRKLGSFTHALTGNRGNPLQTLELVGVGPRTPEVAAESLREQVRRLFSATAL